MRLVQATLEKRAPRLGDMASCKIVDAKPGCSSGGVGSTGVYALATDGHLLHLGHGLQTVDRIVDTQVRLVRFHVR